jgi:hypothetical protein
LSGLDQHKETPRRSVVRDLQLVSEKGLMRSTKHAFVDSFL